jgi:hypothetical protein
MHSRTGSGFVACVVVCVLVWFVNFCCVCKDTNLSSACFELVCVSECFCVCVCGHVCVGELGYAEIHNRELSDVEQH